MNRAMRYLAVIVLVMGARCSWAAEAVTVTPDVVYGHKDGLALTMDVFTPAQANGAGVLFMVSGGWFSHWMPPEQFEAYARPLLDHGFTVFAVRHGSSPRYPLPEIVDDVRRGVRFVRAHAAQFHVDPARLGVTGGSAGGHLSLMLGTTADDGDPQAKEELLHTSDRVAAVVAWYPPTDLRSFVNPETHYPKDYPALRMDATQTEVCSPYLHVTADDAPTLLVHGDQDTLVPLKESQQIVPEFQGKHVAVELLVIPGAGHGYKGAEQDRAWAATVAWFEKYLAKK